jgi:hypothetical protein
MKYQGGEWVEAIKRPTKTSQLENDSGFITEGGVPAVHTLPTDAEDGDMCLYAPQNIITLADSGKKICFDWEEFAKPLKATEATELDITWWDSGFFFYFEAIRNETQNLISYGGLGTQFKVEFNNGLLNTENSYIEAGAEEKKFYKDISELPLYFVIPEMYTERERTENGNAYLFHTEYKLMKYRGGEWVEAVKIPTKLSELENDSGFITLEDIPDNGLTQE